MPFKDPEKKRQYQKEYFQKYYARPDRKERLKKQVRERKRSIRAWYLEYKSKQSCIVCGMSGEKNPWAIEFHHRDPTEKSDLVSSFVASGYSRKRIEEEIEKCDILCANCHRSKHFQERNADGSSLFEKVSSRPQPDVDTKSGKRARGRRRKAREKRRLQRERDNDEKASDSEPSP
jgi:hypothetical protein